MLIKIRPRQCLPPISIGKLLLQIWCTALLTTLKTYCDSNVDEFLLPFVRKLYVWTLKCCPTPEDQSNLVPLLRNGFAWKCRKNSEELNFKTWLHFSNFNAKKNLLTWHKFSRHSGLCLDTQSEVRLFESRAPFYS